MTFNEPQAGHPALNFTKQFQTFIYFLYPRTAMIFQDASIYKYLPISCIMTFSMETRCENTSVEKLTCKKSPCHQNRAVATSTRRSSRQMYFASVCRGWLDIVWSTTHLVIGGSIPGRINFLRDWILHSRMSPLIFYIVAMSFGGIEREFQAVLDTISQCSSQCYSLSIDIECDLLLACPQKVRPEKLKLCGVSYKSLLPLQHSMVMISRIL